MTPTAPGSTGVSVPAPAPAPTPVAAPAGCPVVIAGTVRIPAGITDLDAFRRWALSDDFPDDARVSFLDGEIWVDPSMERGFSHNDVKHEVAGVLRRLARAAGSGRYFGDGMRLSHAQANLSTDPDGVFVSYASQDAGRVRLVPNVNDVDVVELEGTPDMVLEVVSDSSIEKDTQTLPPLYHRAEVPEFWRIDARGDELHFEILQRAAAGWAATQRPDGWWHSAVFARDFRLVREADPRGQPWFTLEERQPPAP